MSFRKYEGDVCVETPWKLQDEDDADDEGLAEFATSSHQEERQSPHLLIEDDDEEEKAVVIAAPPAAATAKMIADLLLEEEVIVVKPQDAFPPLLVAPVPAARKETTYCYSSDDDLVFRPVATKRGKKKNGVAKSRSNMEESITDFEGWKVSVNLDHLGVDPDPET